MYGTFEGFANVIRQRTLAGWAYDSSDPDIPLALQFVVNGKILDLCMADQYRADLVAAGKGNGCHGFEFEIPDEIRKIESIDVYVANTSHRLLSEGLDLEPVNEYLQLFSSTTKTLSDSQTSELLDRAFLNALMKRAVELAPVYQSNKPFPFVFLDDFLPPESLDAVLRDFPEPKRINWEHHNYGYAERKLAFSAPENLPPSIRAVLYFLNSKPMLDFLECVTGIDGLIPDPHYVGGGLHQIETGGKLDVHIDFNRHKKLKLDRRLNLLIYLNKDWPEEYGGNLELWNRDMSRAEASIAPLYNRCAIFNTSEWSYHGHPEPLTCPPERTRKSIALYYYTNGRPEEEVADPHLTVWQQRPASVPSV